MGLRYNYYNMEDNMSKHSVKYNKNSWKKHLLRILLIIEIIIVASFVFLMMSDFHTIALIFQLFIPYFLGPILLEAFPFILIMAGLIIAMNRIMRHMPCLR